MKYVFFISFFYRHFKKPCGFRIYLDDQLIDDVVLDKGINYIENFTEKYINESNKSFYRRLHYFKDGAYHDNVPEKFWLYDIDVTDSNKNIFIEFDVNDSNYTNGFVTQSAMIRSLRVGLCKRSVLTMPKNFFINYVEKIKEQFLETERNLLDASKPTPFPEAPDELYKRPDRWFPYPSPMNYKVKFNNDNSNREWQDISRNGKLSGRFTVKLPLFKKHKQVMIQDASGRKNGVVLLDPFISWLKQVPEVINIYNEDQRSDNT